MSDKPRREGDPRCWCVAFGAKREDCYCLGFEDGDES